MLSLPSTEQRLQFLIELFGARGDICGTRSDNDDGGGGENDGGDGGEDDDEDDEDSDDGEDEVSRRLLNCLKQCADLTSNR